MLDWLLSVLFPRSRSRINTNPDPPRDTQRPPAPPPPLKLPGRMPPPPKPTVGMSPYVPPPPPWVMGAKGYAKDLRNAAGRLEEATTSGQVEDALNSILFFHNRALKALKSHPRVGKERK